MCDELLYHAFETMYNRTFDGLKDEQGFNMTDSQVAKSYMAYPFWAWKDVHKERARDILLGYSRQLAEIGVDINSLKSLSFEIKGNRRTLEKEEIRTVTLKSGEFVLKSKKNLNLVADIKALPKRRFNWDNYSWQVPIIVSNRAGLGSIFEKWGFALSPEAETAWVKLLESKNSVVRKTNRKTNRQIDYNGTKFIVRFPYDGELVAWIKNLPKGFRTFQKEGNIAFWLVSPNLDTATELLEKVNTECFTLTDNARAQIEQLQGNIEKSKATDGEIDIKGLGGVLYGFQASGVAMLLKVNKGVIGDEQGLGKTCQGLALMLERDAFPLVIACPASLMLNWKREVEYWLPGKSVFLAQGLKPYKTYDYSVVIVSYTALKAHVNFLREICPKGFLLDESQKIKNRKTGCTKAAFALSGFELTDKGRFKDPEPGQDIPHIFCLSGTPAVNRPEELLTQLQLTGLTKKLFTSEWSFLQRYCGAKRTRWGWDFSGASNTLELNQVLRASGHYVRRLKKDVLTDLPEKRYSTVSISLEPAGLKKYNVAEKDLAGYLRSEGKTAGNAIHLQRFEALKQLTIELKMKAVCDWVETFLESEEKLILFCTHRKAVETISEKFKAPYLYGGMSPKQKQAVVDDFQENPDTRLAVLNLQAGGVGYTLTAASNVAIVELGWTPGEHLQAEDRAHRIGQLNQVTIWYLLAWETIEREIAELLKHKKQVIGEVTDGKKGEITQEKVLNTLIKRLKEKHG